jgi:hypothetical protein
VRFLLGHEANVPSWRDAAVWLGFGVVFLALELPPAIFDNWYWNTLSWSTWRFEAWWHFAKILVALFLFALGVHLVAKVPEGWLIAVAGAATVGAVAKLAYDYL